MSRTIKLAAIGLLALVTLILPVALPEAKLNVYVLAGLAVMVTVGLSVLSGAHNYLFGRVLDLLKEKGADDIAVFGGGIIPQEDIRALKALGVKELFTPGTSTQDIIRFVRENIRAVA